MRLGQAAIEALRAEITGCLKPGDELVVACPVALKGTSVIAKIKGQTGREILCRFISELRFTSGRLWSWQYCLENCAGGRMPAHYMLWVRAAFKCALEDGRSFRSRTGSRLP